MQDCVYQLIIFSQTFFMIFKMIECKILERVRSERLILRKKKKKKCRKTHWFSALNSRIFSLDIKTENTTHKAIFHEQ